MSGILTGRRILVVEDEMLVAMSIEDTLVDAGGEVIGPAPTVGRALGLLREETKIDAVVLDMNLQGHSGLPVADACDERSIPFLILSGYGDTALNGTHHAAPILSKPFASAVLVETLKTLFGGNRA
ncbi:response regulator [Ensifer sp. ENS12]|uniref:response regulator n=1 Tax=Ensifer sp. ENS12 TaxID=2854774 RepID=UPI001C443980|nr:response regulator [Ensifer sp. ENS12]